MSLPRVLIVDDSRMVRASLAKQLKGHYDIREEGDGEAAWQTLVLDQSVQAVISDLQMPKMDGYGLLERLRSCKLRRLQQIPFIMISGEETEEDRAKAKTLGVSEFITKGVGTTEMLTRLDHLMALSQARESAESGRDQMVQDPRTGLFTRKYVELQAAQGLSHAARHHGPASIMVLGLDGYDAVAEKIGADMAEQLGNRLAKMISAKIRREDCLGHFDQGQYAIISPGSSLLACASFAERVREAVEVAQVAAQGQRVALSVSIGVAAVPEDTVDSAAALLELAGSRMAEAMGAGGNRVIGGAGQANLRQLSLQQALELLRAGRAETVVPHLSGLGEQVLPLLALLNRELALDLPLAVIEQRLSGRARQDNKPENKVV